MSSTRESVPWNRSAISGRRSSLRGGSEPSGCPSDSDGSDNSRPVRRSSSRYHWPDSPWPVGSRSDVKRMEMKPPNFDGRGSVLTFLAKFDNCAAHNKWIDEEKLHYLANSLEDRAAQVLWDMQGCGSYKDLRQTLRRIYGSDDQARSIGPN